MSGAIESVVFFDLETGGLEHTAPVIQIAAAAYRLPAWSEVETFERKVQFSESLCSIEALEINSYDAQAWEREAVPEVKAVQDFASFLEPFKTVPRVSRAGRTYRVARLGGHNVASFDISRLLAMGKRHGVFVPVDLYAPLDTRFGAAWYFARTGEDPPASFKLSDLAQHFGASVEGAHDALVDVRLSAYVARAIVSTGGES